MQDNQTIIHRHLRTISRINTAIAMLGLVAVIALYVWLRWVLPPTSTATPPTTTALPTVVNQSPVTVAEYQAQLNAIIDEYQWSDAAIAQQKSSELLELRVPAEMKQLHIQVVLSFSDAQAGNVEAAQQRMAELKQQYAWLDYQP